MSYYTEQFVGSFRFAGDPAKVDLFRPDKKNKISLKINSDDSGTLRNIKLLDLLNNPLVHCEGGVFGLCKKSRRD